MGGLALISKRNRIIVLSRALLPLIVLTALQGCGTIAMYTAGGVVAVTGRPSEQPLYCTANITVSGPKAAQAQIESIKVSPRVLWRETGGKLRLKVGTTYKYPTRVLTLDGLYMATYVDRLSEGGLSSDTVVRNETEHAIRIPMASIRAKTFPAGKCPHSGPSFDAAPFFPVDTACHTIVKISKPTRNDKPASLGESFSKDEGRVWIPLAAEAVLVQPGEAVLLRMVLRAPSGSPRTETEKCAPWPPEATSGLLECVLEDNSTGEALQCVFEFEFATIAKMAPFFM